MPRPSNTKQRRGEIVQGLLRTMATTGYERASIRQIAQSAGVAPGIVHYHFGSKLQILLALIPELGDRVHARYRSFRAPDGRDAVHALLDAHLAVGEGADPNAVAAWVAIGAEAIAQPEVQAAYKAQLQRTLAELEHQLSAAMGPKAGDRAIEGARALLGAVEGAYQLASAAPGLMPEGYAAPAVKGLADAWMEPATPARR